MTQPSTITLRAGPKAAEHIRKNGLRPEDVAILPGAAGGPKALGIIGLDMALFGDWLPRAKRQRDLIGASIGAWRFASVCRNDPIGALKELGELYCRQRYPKNPSAKIVSDSARDTMRALFAGREHEVLDNPNYRLNVIVMRGLGLLHRESKGKTPAGFAAAALANAMGRHHLRHFAERMWFHAPGGMPGFLPASEAFDRFRTISVPLGKQNLSEALLATASIPLVLEGVADIPGAPEGTYWDGGIIDYHLHLPYHHAEGITLYPHFTDKIIPGWLDKPMPWRRARGKWLENLVLVAPSREYLANLPYKKLPDRKDFKRFELDYDARYRYWRHAMGESERMGAEFLKITESGEIADRLQPL
jgi:hypothetical protein